MSARFQETGEVTAFGSLRGSKLYEMRAREAFPILVRQAKSQQTIYYSDLAHELNMPNARNLNYVLGVIGNELRELSNQWGVEIPPIQCLVINKSDGLPGEGFNWFIKDRERFKQSSRTEKKRLNDLMLHDVYEFNRWDEVLSNYGLKPLKNTLGIASAPALERSFGGLGESPEHKRFKEYISKNPETIGLPSKLSSGSTEYEFPSADAVDVLFINKDEWIGVEVKSSRSPTDDIMRGIYQCTKYRALIEAVQKADQKKPNSRVILALEGSLPKELIGLKNMLGIEVIDKIKCGQGNMPGSPI